MRPPPVTGAAITRRLAELKAAAERLLPKPPGAFKPLRWLSCAELTRLEVQLEEDEAGTTDLWQQLTGAPSPGRCSTST
jgi:hypothetical protein